MHTLLKENIEEIRSLCIKHNIKSLYAFGSVNSDSFNEDSDIDLLIDINPREPADYADTYFLLVNKFEELFSRHVDLVSVKSLANPYFIDSVNQSKILLYEQRNQKVSV